MISSHLQMVSKLKSAHSLERSMLLQLAHVSFGHHFVLKGVVAFVLMVRQF